MTTPARQPFLRGAAILALAAATAVDLSAAAGASGPDRSGRPAPHRISPHFHLESVGSWRSERLERESLAALERWYRSFMIAFAAEPPTPIRVRLYSERTFHASTGAPSWADGSYARGQGIQVASGGVARLEPAMERVLAHELAHAFITARSAGRAPRWLQEGLAQALAPGGEDPPAPVAASSPDDLDHAGAHAFVQALIAAHGLATLLDLVAGLGQGEELGAAFRSRLGGPEGALLAGWQRSRSRATAETRP